MDGFLWIAKDGNVRTTHQAMSLMRSGPYGVAPGAEVMVSLAAGWPALMSDAVLKKRDADGIMRAGAGWDVFFLCPDHALQLFEAAAKLSSVIGAYNAAVMHLERGNPGDADAAAALLSQAAAAGDQKAKAQLEQLRHEGEAH
jgi:TPR repeat protein